MKNYIFFFFLMFSISLTAQSLEKYSLVSVVLEEDKTIEQLTALGIETDHGTHVRGRYLKNIFSEKEIEKITAAGFKTKIVIDDWQSSFLNKEITSRTSHCEGVSKIKKYPVPGNFSLGSMAGYYTYQEMLDNLDSMAAKYPDLITPRAEIGDFKTYNDNPIYWLEISKNAGTDENEPEIFYNAIHHAREPMGLTQLIFFMWYLLENYGTDPEVTYLLDNTALFFVPCINPDGYLFNEITNPEGGGMWRKNRRDNLDGEWGVDLNRNYGFSWGYDDDGSSPVTADETYRGTEVFSEPETQAVKSFCEEHDFLLAMNYHSHGDLLIYPWGYLDTPTNDSTDFRTFADAMSRYNDYVAGTGTETVGYTVNGDSDDWMYGDRGIFSMTPEVGSAFWTDEEEIWENCHSALWMNLATANIPHEFGWAKDLSETKIEDLDGHIKFEYTQAGMTPSEITVTLTGISPEIISTGSPIVYNLNLSEKSIDSIAYSLVSDVEDGMALQFLMTVSSPYVSWSDTLSKTFRGDRETVFEDPADELTAWFKGNDAWDLDSEFYYSAPTSIGDSPGTDYERDQNESLLLIEPLDLTGVENAKLNFYARWDIEADYDYAQISGSIDGRTFTPLCGLYTRSGTANQDEDEPLWDGLQSEWVEEEIDLEDFIGESNVIIRFDFVSDRFVSGAGFNFDDFSLTVKAAGSSSTTTFVENDFEKLTVRPNPATDNFILEINNSHDLKKDAEVFILNTLGEVVATYSAESLVKNGALAISAKDWSAGIYYLQIYSSGKRTESKRIVLLD